MDPADLHGRVELAFNDADVEALVALYEPDAQMVRDDQSVVTGVDEMREDDGSRLSVIDGPFGAAS